MTSKKTYSSPEAFKTALEQRLKTSTAGGADVQRKRQLVVFDRFLARVAAELGDAAILKGGLVLELRLERARTTKDVDMRVLGNPDEALARLQAAGRRDLGDFMTFEVAPHKDHPEMQGDDIKYDGLRFRAECRLAGKLYGQPFGVDIAFGDPIIKAPDEVTAEDTLAFAGVPPPKLRLYPVETHIAEKLHAYTMPRSRPNSRVKDLPDLALLATTGAIDANELRAALKQTFKFRGTHAVPAEVPPPMPAWKTPYEKIASDDELPWKSFEDLTAAVKAFLDPVLRGATGTWDPDTWTWN